MPSPIDATHRATPGTPMAGTPTSRDAKRLKAANRRVAFILLAIALLFFFGIILSRLLGDPDVSIGVVGGAVLLYLVVAIGRHLRK